MPVPS
jgi:hypothetical protein